MPSNPQPARRKRLKPTLICGLIVIPLALLTLAVDAWYSEAAKLNAKLAALRAAGQPTTLTEVNDFYIVPEGVADTTDLWVEAIDGVVDAYVLERGKSLPFIGIDGKTPVTPPGEEWADLEASRTLINELDTEMQAIWRAAAADGQVRYPVDFSEGTTTRFPYSHNARHVANLLSLDAQVAAHSGNGNRALQDIKAIYATSDSIRGEPFFDFQFLRMAIHAVGQSQIELLLPYCDWNDGELLSLQQAVGSAKFKQEIRNAISGERAHSLSALGNKFMGPFCNSNKLELLQFFEGYHNSVKGNWNQTLQWQREFSTELESRKASILGQFRLMGVSMVSSGFEYTTTAGGRAAARQRTTVIAIAAQRHRLKHGQLPTSLSEIDPALLGAPASTVLSDPFADQPLLFKSDKSGIIIYSVGDNQQDDGGNVDLANVPRDKQDIGFRLTR